MSAVFEFQRWLYGEATGALVQLHSAGLPGLPAVIAAAVALGLLHALLPGHGKSILASYYTADGTPTGAVISSAILILTHVGSAVVIVLGGLAILERTVGRAGRSPALEGASSVLIVLIGLWLLWSAARPVRHDHGRSGAALAFVAGLVPCPLTAFVMTYAAANAIVAAGLVASAAFASGMIVTVAAFPLVTILLRTRFVPLLARTEQLRIGIARILQFGGAGAIVLMGLWMLFAR